MHTLVTVRLTYGNALLYGARDSVQRQAVRVVCKRIKYEMHTSVTELLWLPITYPVQSTIAGLQDIYFLQTTVSL